MFSSNILYQSCLEHFAIGSHQNSSKYVNCSCTWGKTFWHGESKPDIGLIDGLKEGGMLIFKTIYNLTFI
jgi:hypothetical protein